MRMARISPDENLIYYDPLAKHEWVIPAGTPVSMDAQTVALNSKNFPKPHEFMPERWIDNKGLDKYVLSFSKGSRICLGCVLHLIISLMVLAYEI